MPEYRQFGPGIALAPVLALTLGASGALAGPPESDHCISPSGLDTNEFYDLTEALVAPFCAQIPAGGRWRVLQAWFMNLKYGAKPPGFKPVGKTPLDDFLAKFEGVRYVVDPGSAQEKTYVVPTSDDLYTNPDTNKLAVANPVTLNFFEALSVGPHRVEVYWTMSAMHCDGLGVVVAENCLPAGEFLLLGVDFEVVAGQD